MKRIAAAVMVLTLGVPLATQGVSAGADRLTVVGTTSRNWFVTLSIARTTLRSGSAMAATLSVDNKTGHTFKLIGCFGAVLGNAKVSYPAVSSSEACFTSLGRGTSVFHFSILATYQVCGGATNPACRQGGGMVGLPTGRYRAVVQVPHVTPSMPSPGIVTVTVTK
jgi:hypothetical protein